MAWLLGKVQGVVVQISAYNFLLSRLKMLLGALLISKRTYTEGLTKFESYSNSASANAVLCKKKWLK